MARLILQGWNRSAVRVTFLIDTCGREIIAWEATTGGSTGKKVRNLMFIALENRFGSGAPPQPIQCLTDYGSACNVEGPVAFAELLGLVPCFTPVRSPESNGMAESFVKTFKRDCVYVHDRQNTKRVLGNI